MRLVTAAMKQLQQAQTQKNEERILLEDVDIVEEIIEENQAQPASHSMDGGAAISNPIPVNIL
jgi:hypothetical protein